jgi:NAD(P)-dependent dehydrogenase (short-subunit alcohol dehydrogenase family)
MMPWGSSIINNASINPFVGHPKLLDYTSTKGAIVAFTRALSNQIVKDKGIRVNAVVSTEPSTDRSSRVVWLTKNAWNSALDLS